MSKSRQKKSKKNRVKLPQIVKLIIVVIITIVAFVLLLFLASSQLSELFQKNDTTLQSSADFSENITSEMTISNRQERLSSPEEILALSSTGKITNLPETGTELNQTKYFIWPYWNFYFAKSKNSTISCANVEALRFDYNWTSNKKSTTGFEMINIKESGFTQPTAKLEIPYNSDWQIAYDISYIEKRLNNDGNYSYYTVLFNQGKSSGKLTDATCTATNLCTESKFIGYIKFPCN